MQNGCAVFVRAKGCARARLGKEAPPAVVHLLCKRGGPIGGDARQRETENRRQRIFLGVLDKELASAGGHILVRQEQGIFVVALAPGQSLRSDVVNMIHQVQHCLAKRQRSPLNRQNGVDVPKDLCKLRHGFSGAPVGGRGRVVDSQLGPWHLTGRKLTLKTGERVSAGAEEAGGGGKMAGALWPGDRGRKTGRRAWSGFG